MISKKEECPSFNFTKKNHEIILPNRILKEISLPVQNLAYGNVLFGCLINIENIQTYIPARLINNNIVCAPTRFAYEKENATSLATVTAVWNKINFIDKINSKIFLKISAQNIPFSFYLLFNSYSLQM